MGPSRSVCKLLVVAVAAPLLLVLLLAATPGSSVLTSGKGELLQGPDDLCLGCICEATTNCNLTFGCNRGLCGPFLISQPYWQDAGSPVLAGDHIGQPGAFGRCVQDPYCAATTVRQYMNRFAQDCNGNRQIDCDDFARIHYLGGYRCQERMEGALYYEVFHQCLTSVQQLNG